MSKTLTDSPRTTGTDAAGTVSVASTLNPVERTTMAVIFAMSFSHLLNDTIQSLIPAMYPVLRDAYKLTYAEVGTITMVSQLSGSILQPVVGLVADRKPMPFSLAIGMCFSLVGLILLGMASRYGVVLLAVGVTGIGSSIFHPEASRIARAASGGRYGLAQSLFQVGGNFGTSLGPILAALIITPYGQRQALWFTLVAFAGIIVLWRAGLWYRTKLVEIAARKAAEAAANGTAQAVSAAPVKRLPTRKIVQALVIIVALVFSKQVYLASMTNFYTFYLMAKFGIEASTAQILLFVFLFSVAAGTFIGGPVGDRVGRKAVIWVSILGVAPFTLLMPQMTLPFTVMLSVVIGLVLASAFSAILVYAQELIPGKVGLIAGLFFGFAFGTAGIASALLGKLADATDIQYVFFLCGFLPLIGLVTAFLPDTRLKKVASSG